MLFTQRSRRVEIGTTETANNKIQITVVTQSPKAAFNAIALDTIEGCSNILPAVFVVHFVMDRLKKVRQGLIALFLLLLLFIFDKMKKNTH